MRRMVRFATALLLLGAGCVAVASAAEDETAHDVLVLSTGERLEGTLVDVRDGRYWLLLADGRTVGVDFRTVSAVDMADARAEPIPASQLPLPTWPNREVADGQRAVAGGFDMGLTQGGRVRFRFDNPAISHLDTTLGVQPMLASGLGFGLLAGVQAAFPQRSVVRLTLGTSIGAGLIYGSFYPYVGAAVGLQIDPRGPFEFHLGADAGTTFSSLAVVPKLHTTWMW